MRPENEKIIKDFLQDWYQSLIWQSSQTVLGAELPLKTADQLYNDSFGFDLRVIGDAAEKTPDQWTQETAEEALDSVQKVCEWMFSRPRMGAEYKIPAEFWATPIGWLCLTAYMWAHQDRLITISEAAELLHRPISTIASRVERGALTAYIDPNETNPRRQTRISLAEISKK